MDPSGIQEKNLHSLDKCDIVISKDTGLSHQSTTDTLVTSNPVSFRPEYEHHHMNRPDRATNLPTAAAWRPGLSSVTPYGPPPPPPPPQNITSVGPFLTSTSVPSHMYFPPTIQPFPSTLMLPGLPNPTPTESLFKSPTRFPHPLSSNPYLTLPTRHNDPGLFNPAAVAAAAAAADTRLFFSRPPISPPSHRKMSPVIPLKPPGLHPASCMRSIVGLLGGPGDPCHMSCPSPTQGSQHLPWSPEEASSGSFRYHLPDRKATSFCKGTMVRVGNGCKRVEELSTNDFIQSARKHPEYKLEMSCVLRIEENHSKETARVEFAVGKRREQVVLDVSVTQPFFVYERGWSSCDPSKTLERLKLNCFRLVAGDACISLATNSRENPAATASSSVTETPLGFSQPPLLPHLQGMVQTSTSGKTPPIASCAGLPSTPGFHIPLPEAPMDIDGSELECESNDNKYFKKIRRWQWDNNNPLE